MTRISSLAKQVWPPLLLAVVFFATWEAVVSLSGSRKLHYIMPQPTRIFDEAVKHHDALLSASWNSAFMALSGFCLSLIVGCLIAFIMSQARWVERSAYPYAIFLQTVPIVAIAPIILLWFEAGYQAIIMISFIISLFPIITSTTTGLTHIPKEWDELMTVYNANWWQRLTKLRIPTAVPFMINGARISAGLSIVGAIVGEYFTGLSSGGGDDFGLAYLLMSTQADANFPYLFATTFSAAIMGLCIFACVNGISKWIMTAGHFEEV
jgi:NitT/TauT family transport system permease protein